MTSGKPGVGCKRISELRTADPQNQVAKDIEGIYLGMSGGESAAEKMPPKSAVTSGFRFRRRAAQLSRPTQIVRYATDGTTSHVETAASAARRIEGPLSV
jgi:hypothetical protein